LAETKIEEGGGGEEEEEYDSCSKRKYHPAKKKNAKTHSSHIQRARPRTGRSCLLLRRKTVAGALATAMSAAGRAIRAALFRGAIDALRGGGLSSRRRP